MKISISYLVQGERSQRSNSVKTLVTASFPMVAQAQAQIHSNQIHPHLENLVRYRQSVALPSFSD